MSRTILILGGSYAGVQIAHKLLKGTAPTVDGLKVIIVNPSSKFYWNMASVRAIVPGIIPDDQLFQDIEPGFTYAGKAFEFIQGTADGLNAETKTVEIKTPSGVKTQSYDTLIIATGSRGDSKTPWKHGASHEETLADLHAAQEKVKAAQSIVVGGGGSTGTETAAELGYEYGTKKEITIITAGETLLAPSMTPAINAGAESTIEKFGVKIIRKTRVTSSSISADGKTELTLSDGKRLVVDLYLPTTGLIPNTSFLPKNWLNERGEVVVDLEFKVKAAPNAEIYAFGDVAQLERSGIIITQAQGAALYKSLNNTLRGKEPIPYKVADKEMMAVALGRKTGTGIAMGWKLPGFMVYYAKGKTLGIQKVKAFVDTGAM